MQGSKRVFRPAKTAEEEKKLLDDAVPKSTRNTTKWAYRIFNEWQLARRNKDPRSESCSFMYIIMFLAYKIYRRSLQTKWRTLSGKNSLQCGLWASAPFGNGKWEFGDFTAF